MCVECTNCPCPCGGTCSHPSYLPLAQLKCVWSPVTPPAVPVWAYSSPCLNVLPTLAIGLLLQVIDFRLINLQISISEILTKLKIYHYGLTVSDLEYLKVIHENNNSAIGIKTLVQITGYDSYTIENYIEPFLLKINLLIKTSKGRILTKKGIELLNKLENEI